MDVLTSACDVWHQSHMHKLGQHILRYVSNFRRSERDNQWVIGKKPSQKHFEKTNN